MSQENVEALRSFWETWNTSEAPDMSLLDPDVTYEDTVLPDHIGETYRGPEGVARAVARWFEPFAKITISLERIVGDGDRLVSVHRWRAKAKHTGIEFENPSLTPGRGGTGRLSISSRSGTQTRPSKPWGWRSRRCRRSTWRSPSGSSMPSTGAI
jgi:ketosteroid isomerase-like protein